MTNNLSNINDTPKFYQISSGKGKTVGPANANSLFQTQLLAAQSMISTARGLGLSKTSILLETTMLETLTKLAQQLREDKSGATNRVSAATPEISNSSRKFAVAVKGEEPTAATGIRPSADSFLGHLSARYESGAQGIAAIGYDPNGGTSYGRYQLSSRAGSMDRFIEFLDDKAPEWGARLRSSGTANTGSTTGAMPDTWRAIAQEDGGLFAALQHDFIRQEYYLPAREMILKRSGLDFEQAPQALREVLWSTAVQHGPSGAARIFARAAERFAAGGEGDQNHRELIKDIFTLRSKQFVSSPERVQAAVKNRFSREQNTALAMLDAAVKQSG